MLGRGKLRIALATAMITAAFLGVAALPAASASTCTVTVTLVTGQTLYFQLPQGAPLSSLNLSAPVKSISESCGNPTPAPTTSTQSAPPPTTSTSTQSTTPTTSTGSTSTPSKKTKPGSTTTSPSTTTPHKKSSTAPKTNRPSKKPTSSHKAPAPATKPQSNQKPAAKKPATATKPAPPVSTNGVPTPANPSFSFSLPGPTPLGVPNFFIDSFRIPPFLIPIYQAAGIEYDVPWQILAAINEIETDYGRNLSVSTAGAVGWMQFMPQTWKQYGVDANGDGVADPYNPVDAIFTAARYLHAAGATKNLGQSIFAYNHAAWYVESVLLRAKLIGGLPDKLVDSITGLVEGYFPVAAQAKYADDAVEQLAKKKVKGTNAAVPVTSDPASTAVSIFAKQNSPVIAVNDGKIVAVGQNAQFGKYIELQDATGNVYTYAHLGSIPKLYPVPKPQRVTAAQIAKQLDIPAAPKPKTAASAGTQQAPTARPPVLKVAKVAKTTTRTTTKTTNTTTKSSSAAPITLPVAPAPKPAATPASAQGQSSTSSSSVSTPLVKERLFADPTRPASYAAGGALQVKDSAPQLQSFQNYFSNVLHLAKNQYTLQPLKKGSIVIAGTILGRLAAGTPKLASHVDFLVRPAGKNSPYIDPKPILDGWKLLEATAVYRAAGVDPFFGPNAKNPTIGQLLLMSKSQLTEQVLNDPHVQIYACGRRDIQAGLIDRRILATIEFLSASALDPTVSGLECGHSLTGSTGVDAAGATGSSIDISKINNIPIQSHQGAGSIADLTIRRLLTLQGALKPDEIVSLMSYKGQSNTLALPDHTNRLQISYTPLFGTNKKLSAEVAQILKPTQWIQLINRLGQITEPIVPITPSQYAIKVPNGPKTPNGGSQ